LRLVTGETLNRRDFLARVAGAGSGAAFGAAAFHDGRLLSGLDALASLSRGSLDRIGVQLYTVRAAMRESVERTLEQVARIGYKEVEFAGYFNRPAKDIRALLDANGLSAPSAHSADLPSIRTRFPQVLEDAAIVGHKYVICASLPRQDQTADGFKRAAEEFNRAGELSARAGITVGFHNHDGEFNPLGDTNGYDILLAECDPGLVTMQMDLFWTKKAGKDPLAYFAKYPGRFSSVHVKDMTASGEMVDVGAGGMPFRDYFRQSAQAGIRHYFVEHDSPGNPMVSITNSFRHLSALQP
jgi:sugar phosphate isomerase/epimerase